MFYSPFSIAISSLGEERANLSAFRTFVRFALIWFCLFPLPLGVWEWLRLVIVAHPGLFLTFFALLSAAKIYTIYQSVSSEKVPPILMQIMQIPLDYRQGNSRN